MPKKISGLFLILIAVAVVVYTVVEPLNYAAGDSRAPWAILDPLMMVAVLVGVIFGYARKKKVDREGGGAAVTREFLAANTAFYGFLFVGILLSWNWFNLLNPEFTAIGDDTVTLVWVLVDSILPLLSVAMGMFLLRGDTRA